MSLLALSASSAALAGIEPGSLRLDRQGPDLILTWEAGTPAYGVFRSADPRVVVGPANQIAIVENTRHAELVGASPPRSFFLVGTPSGDFPCGELLCSIAAEYCLVTYPPIPEAPIEYECRPIPAACPPLEICPCVEQEWEDEIGAAVDCLELDTGAHVITLALP